MPKLTYLGHAAFLLEGAGTALVIDPFLTGNPNAAKKPEDVKVDWIVLTHGHGDHLGDALEIAKANNATIIAPFELATYCGNKGVNAHPMHIGGSHEFPFGRVKLTIAHHGSAVVDGEQIIYTGNPCGVLITMEDKTFYHPGDTGLFYDMKLIGKMNPIDLAVLPIGDNFTMGIDDAVKATELLNPKKVVPMHYDTFDIIKADPEEFVRRVQEKGFEAQVLEYGGSLEF
jgi:L-ascorbate metabolism protein UlaG (beta-lactamase superfamily)